MSDEPTQIEADEDELEWEDDFFRCETCGGSGTAIVGVDDDIMDGISGPSEGDVIRCPDCDGHGEW